MRGTVNYLTKYMTKTDTKLIYSRGVPDEFKGIEMDQDDIIFVLKKNNGYLAILANSAMGLMDIYEEPVTCFFEDIEMNSFADCFIDCMSKG